MAPTSFRESGFVAPFLKGVSEILYSLSPYKWVDACLRKKEARHPEESEAWKSVRHWRYCAAEIYILLWLVIGVCLCLHPPPLEGALLNLMVSACLLRAIGILNKELCVVLFGSCKINVGREVSTPARIVLLGLANYATISFLFAVIYQAVKSMPPGANPVIQSLSVSLAFGPAFEPSGTAAWGWVCAHGVVNFLFVGLILVQFISLLQLVPDRGD